MLISLEFLEDKLKHMQLPKIIVLSRSEVGHPFVLQWYASIQICIHNFRYNCLEEFPLLDFPSLPGSKGEKARTLKLGLCTRVLQEGHWGSQRKRDLEPPAGTLESS